MFWPIKSHYSYVQWKHGIPVLWRSFTLKILSKIYWDFAENHRYNWWKWVFGLMSLAEQKRIVRTSWGTAIIVCCVNDQNINRIQMYAGRGRRRCIVVDHLGWRTGAREPSRSFGTGRKELDWNRASYVRHAFAGPEMFARLVCRRGLNNKTACALYR